MKAAGTDELCINTLRMLSLDAVQKANSGHPGLPLGAAPMAYALWSRFMRFNPADPAWPDRDRFILSAGHGSALLYCILHLMGYDLSMEELMSFRQWGSKTPGHPEYEPGCGVETTTGPLGQGFANGVGIAVAEAHLSARFNRPGHEIVNHYTYAIASDGDLMEGVASEAASLAGHLRLGKIVYLYDSNGISLAGDTRLTFTEDVGKRFEAYGWHVQAVPDGNDLDAIEGAIRAARGDERPSLIIVSTHIGYGSPKQDTFGVHGSPLKPDEVVETKRRFGWPPEQSFYVPEEARARFGEIASRSARHEDEWKALMKSYGEEHPDLMRQWRRMINSELPDGWDGKIPVFEPDQKGIATRAAGGRVMNALNLPNLIGGSADLDPSTNTVLKGKGSFQPPGTGDEGVQGAVPGAWGFEGANMAFGVREHGMGGLLNGIAVHGGLIPYGATFLVFSDFMRPAVRLAALTGLHVIYVFTHDSVGVGEDGPTHQPVEHVSSLRAMPNLTVIRPADANETAEAWKTAILHRGGPVALILSRQKLPVLDRKRYASAEGLRRGAYILADPAEGGPEVMLIATGSEVHLALGAYERLSAEGLKARVVSMPSWELFEAQPEDYRSQVLPPGVTKRLSIEAGASHGWHKYVGREGAVMGIDRFGASAPGEVVLEKFGFTVENILNKVKEILNP